jgi:hypothetical protein
MIRRLSFAADIVFHAEAAIFATPLLLLSIFSPCFRH